MERTPLHDAAKEGDVRRVGVLVEERKEYLWTKDERGRLPIHYAASFGGPAVVRFFAVHANGHPKGGDMINAQIKDGRTPLHLASEKGDAASLEVLVREGRADPWIRDENGWLPMHSAAWFGQPEAVRFFLKYNASHPERGDMLNERDYKGNTPLSCAVQEGHVKCVRLLLEAGADVTIANEEGETPLDLAEEGSDILSLLTCKLSLLTLNEKPEERRKRGKIEKLNKNMKDLCGKFQIQRLALVEAELEFTLVWSQRIQSSYPICDFKSCSPGIGHSKPSLIEFH
ncbi:unnamed protein product [Cyprideis torosa]|uniref:Uncharacterized protein n=1 Tax=Cyprideis torosa TaxID=163714 RepID=A0A7R8ZVM2_9CRUS|nr:unnamed protein product [Cyprideis torosa]CAG0903591.1 unnamed protein product [Cyprideis torosa]